MTRRGPTRPARASAALVAVRAERLVPGLPPRAETCRVAMEARVILEAEGVGRWDLAATPCDLDALAIGFLAGEGLVRRLGDVSEIGVERVEPGCVRIEVGLAAVPAPVGRAVRASGPMVEAMKGPAVTDGMRISAAGLLGLHRRAAGRQALFRRTGGAHAALLFGARGRVIAFAEDVSRASAQDKAVGMCLLAGRPAAGCGLVLSGRIGFQSVLKAARAGLELVSGVSAPLDLAIDLAAARGVTVCGFARGDRVTVFTRPHRVADPGASPSLPGSRRSGRTGCWQGSTPRASRSRPRRAP